METVPLLDRALSGRALVFGSLPPQGRDIDLLVPDEQLGAIAAALGDAGFERVGAIWARFEGCPPAVVEVVAASSWALPEAELDRLFSDGLTLTGCDRLIRPAPGHALLILAGRVARTGLLTPRFRDRVDAAIREDPDAFAAARECATAWGRDWSLLLLKRAYENGRPLPAPARAGAIASELRARGRGPGRSAAGVARAFLGRPRLGAVVALSGLDGSGKSTQARLLAESLRRLGHEAAVEWPAIDAPSRSIAALTRLGKGAVGAVSGQGHDGEGGGDPARALRERSELVTFAWSGIYALRGAARVARMTWPHLLRGRVVVCDRYLLDSRVFLLHRYGEGRRYALQLCLLRLLAPRPRAAFLIDVEPALAAARQPERGIAENAERARLYRSAAPGLGVEVIDGDRPADAVCAAISRRTWRAITRDGAG